MRFKSITIFISLIFAFSDILLELKKPKIESINRSNGLLSRVKEFLPQIAEANKHLEDTESTGFDPIIIEESDNSHSSLSDTSEEEESDNNKPIIEMDVLLYGCDEKEEDKNILIEEK